MDLGAFLILAFFVPLGLAAFVGWAQGDEIGPWLAAAPTPVFVLLLTIPHGIYMMHTLDGTDMRQASGYLEVIFGVIMAGLSFAVGLGAGYLKRRKVRRQ
ncbi:MAG TPA: hypothetical protein VF067_04350 [Sphingomicrobium sp.]